MKMRHLEYLSSEFDSASMLICALCGRKKWGQRRSAIRSGEEYTLTPQNGWFVIIRRCLDFSDVLQMKAVIVQCKYFLSSSSSLLFLVSVYPEEPLPRFTIVRINQHCGKAESGHIFSSSKSVWRNWSSKKCWRHSGQMVILAIFRSGLCSTQTAT